MVRDAPDGQINKLWRHNSPLLLHFVKSSRFLSFPHFFEPHTPLVFVTMFPFGPCKYSRPGQSIFAGSIELADLSRIYAGFFFFLKPRVRQQYDAVDAAERHTLEVFWGWEPSNPVPLPDLRARQISKIAIQAQLCHDIVEPIIDAGTIVIKTTRQSEPIDILIKQEHREETHFDGVGSCSVRHTTEYLAMFDGT